MFINACVNSSVMCPGVFLSYKEPFYICLKDETVFFTEIIEYLLHGGGMYDPSIQMAGPVLLYL